MYHNLFGEGLFAQMDRLQRQMQQASELNSPNIRGLARGFPAINIGHTPGSTEIYAFVPGVDPQHIDVTIDRGVLSISGERLGAAGAGEGKSTVHASERFQGRFHRVISLPEDSNSAAVEANCRDGVLHVSVKRHESAQPRRVEVH